MVSIHSETLCLPAIGKYTIPDILLYQRSPSIFPRILNESHLTTPHTDRPVIRIKRKGRPFATCTICNATPCTAPIEHARAKRDAELKCPKVRQTRNTASRHFLQHGKEEKLQMPWC